MSQSPSKLAQFEEEILTVSDLFEAITQQYEAGVTADTEYYNEDNFGCLDQIETDDVKFFLNDFVEMLGYVHSEKPSSNQICNREKCIENLTGGSFDEMIGSACFSDAYADVLYQAECECEEYEVVGSINQNNLEEFDLWCSKVDELVYERLEFPNSWHIVECLQANTVFVRDFDFEQRFSSAMAQDNFPADGFLYNYLQTAKECLEEYADELETYLNLAIQMTLEWEKSQKENKETTCNE